jgi:hypothetical protein
MSVAGFVVLAIAVWATYASVRTIRRIGLRRFGMAVGRLGWDLGKVASAGLPSWAARWRHRQQAVRMTMTLIQGSRVPTSWTSTIRQLLRAAGIPLYIGDYFDKKEGEV